MSTFYLLPSRSQLGDRIADFLHTILPGLDWDSATREDLTELITTVAEANAGVYVIFRDELPVDEPTSAALSDIFGADVGDEIVEMLPFGTSGASTSRRWRLK